MSHRPIRMPALLALLVVALVALPATLALASPSAAPTAHAAKRCARARRCRRSARRPSSSGGVPRPFNPLFNADKSLRVLVSFQQARGGKPRQVVDFRAGNVPMTCTTSGSALRTGVIMVVPLRGSSFGDDQIDSSGGRKHLTGHFVNASKAVGEFQQSYPDPRGGTCDTGKVQFTATR